MPRTASELAQELELTTSQVREYLERARLPLSLDLRLGDNYDTELGEMLEDPGASPEIMSHNLPYLTI